MSHIIRKGHHDITEILLKVALNTIAQTKPNRIGGEGGAIQDLILIDILSNS
jgi:hypothetical protein